MADFSLSTNVNGEIVIIKTSGYLNNIGGEKRFRFFIEV